MTRPTRNFLAAGAALVLVAGTVWFELRPEHSSPAPDRPPAAARQTSAPTPPELSTSDELEPGDPDATLDVDQTPVVDEKAFRDKLARTLDIYKEETVYPLWSRLADGRSPDLIDWNRPIRIGQPFAADRDGREIEAHVTLDHSFAGPGDSLAARIEVFRTVGHLTVTPDKLAARVEVYASDKVGWEVASAIKVAQVGQVWEARFVPAAIEALANAPRPARVVVRVEQGTFFKELPLSFRYAAAGALAIKDKLAEHVRDGSLEVDFAVEVHHAQPTLVQAVLYDGKGTTPIATYSNWFRPTATGPQTLTLTFFGKAIRAKNLPGPYRIKELHGHVRVPDADPLEVWWSRPDEPALFTASYSPTAFSDKGYDSPETRATIAHYEELIRNGVPR